MTFSKKSLQLTKLIILSFHFKRAVFIGLLFLVIYIPLIATAEEVAESSEQNSEINRTDQIQDNLPVEEQGEMSNEMREGNLL